MKQNIEENVNNFINRLNDKHDRDKFDYYIKESIWKPSQGEGSNSSKNEILQDYLENSDYQEYISIFLNKRLNWERVEKENNEFDYSYTGPDEYVNLPKKYMTVDIWAELSKEEKNEIVQATFKKKEKLKHRENLKGSEFNRDIQYRSKINNRIPKLTRLLGNKYTFYTIIEEYGSDKTIAKETVPHFTIFNTVKQKYPDIVKKFVQESKNDVFILRPVTSMNGIGLVILPREKLLHVFPDYVNKKFKNSVYIRWMISEFKESFLWKLNNQLPESNVLLKENPIRKKEFLGRQLGLWDKDKVPTMKNIKEVSEKIILAKYPSKLSHLRFQDQSGRINKGRLWFIYQVKETSVLIHVYNKVQFELCPEEFSFSYENPYKIIPDLGKEYYTETFNMDKTNAGRASDLNLSKIIDWKTGKGFPKNWDKVKKNLIFVLNSIVNSLKYTSVCMSYGNDNVETLNCYQCLSMDFIVDNKSNAWVLECNTKPWVGHGKWWKKFDPEYKHINDKWLFLDSLLNLTVDQFIKPKKSTGTNYKNHWTKVVEITKRKFGHPIVYRKDIAPIEGILKANNLYKNLIKVFNDRGWSIFPWQKYLDSPDLVRQGTVGLAFKTLFDGYYDRKKAGKLFPDNLKTSIINRIFPLSVYFGDKSMLVKLLKKNLPNKWHTVVPWGFSIDKTKKNWKKDLVEKCEKGKVLYNNPNLTWIIKPSHGLQGIGIIISDDTNKLIEHIEKSQDNVWVLSLYIADPLLLKQKKNHIRVFVLVRRDRKGIKGYLFGRHFVFMAPLEYKKCQDSNYKGEKDFCNLTNLAVGAKYYEMKGKDPKDAYGDLSGIAQDEFDKDTYNQGLYRKFKQTDEYKKMENDFKIFNENLKKTGKKQLEKTYYNTVILPQIREMVHDTISAASSHITCIQQDQKHFDSCYQYTAFDIMFDDGQNGKSKPKCWLLEVNTTPGLRATTAQGQYRVLQFLNNMFDIVISKREKLPNTGKYEQLFREVYTLDKPVTPKLQSLVTDRLMLERVIDRYHLPRGEELKKYRPQEIPKYKRHRNISSDIKMKLKMIKQGKVKPRVKACLEEKNSEQLRNILKSNKVPYSGLNKMQMCYLIQKLKL